MLVSIVDLSFPLSKQANRGLAAQWLGWELDRRGIVECDICDADVILATSVDPIQVSILARLRRLYPGKVLVCGGAASISPSVIGRNCDMVCV